VPAQREQDFPPGHPGRSDYSSSSSDAREWARLNVHPLGEPSFPVGHPGRADTPGNFTSVEWRGGVDPLNPHIEPFTGRTPEEAEAVRAMSEAASKAAAESPVLPAIDAADVAARMAAKRQELGQAILTPEQVSAVLEQVYAERKAKGE